ncbi:hypothetical protein NVP1262O_19 [Vibrio phage 1.262.O._10N.286.51.A9]|nr:hypothetical protein NVP1262O_19 [Vibrio phage 1.262.O._10N.286.51.A9]
MTTLEPTLGRGNITYIQIGGVSIYQQPENTSPDPNDVAVFISIASNWNIVQWQYSDDEVLWFDVDGANSEVLSVSDASLTPDRFYRALYDGIYGGQVYTNSVKMAIIIDPGYILINGGAEAGVLSPWVATPNGIYVTTTALGITPHRGNYQFQMDTGPGGETPYYISQEVIISRIEQKYGMTFDEIKALSPNLNLSFYICKPRNTVAAYGYRGRIYQYDENDVLLVTDGLDLTTTAQLTWVGGNFSSPLHADTERIVVEFLDIHSYIYSYAALDSIELVIEELEV